MRLMFLNRKNKNNKLQALSVHTIWLDSRRDEINFLRFFIIHLKTEQKQQQSKAKPHESVCAGKNIKRFLRENEVKKQPIFW